MAAKTFRILRKVPAGSAGLPKPLFRLSKLAYGRCPHCGADGKTRERRPDGNDTCANGHVYPSRLAVAAGAKHGPASIDPHSCKNVCPSCGKVKQCSCEVPKTATTHDLCCKCAQKMRDAHASGDNPVHPTAPMHPGKAVFFDHGGTRVAGVFASLANGGEKAVVRLCVPDENGLLLASDATAEVALADLVPCDAPHADRKVKAWSASEPLEADGTKGVAVREEGSKVIEDWTGVQFVGYGSTFVGFTPKDRDGDSVLPGAFTETIKDFMRNPVMLTDHRNSVDNIAGSYSLVMQDEKGLKVTGKVTDAPGMRDLRFKIMEGHLKTLSMGGLFLYGPDGHTIEKAYLFEISLVAVPANPDATFQSRALDLDTAAKMFGRRAAKAMNLQTA